MKLEELVLEQLAECDFCPSEIGLKNYGNLTCDGISCVECWRYAFKEKEEE